MNLSGMELGELLGTVRQNAEAQKTSAEAVLRLCNAVATEQGIEWQLPTVAKERQPRAPRAGYKREQALPRDLSPEVWMTSKEAAKRSGMTQSQFNYYAPNLAREKRNKQTYFYKIEDIIALARFMEEKRVLTGKTAKTV